MGGTVSTSSEKNEGAGYTLDKGIQYEITDKIHVAQIIALAEQAGQRIKEIYQSKEAENWDVEIKSDNSPLTKADMESNRIICKGLKYLTPHIPVISEENKEIDYEVRQKYQYSWCVDPLDGTKEFLKRNGQFTVNIALVQYNEPIVGVVHTPMAGTTHWGVKGQGAFVRFEGQDKPIECEEFDPQQEGLWIVASASHMNSITEEFVGQYNSPKYRQLGSSLKLLLIAEGLAHVYPRLAPTCEWDTAAAHVIVTEAGGKIVQAGLCDNKGNPLEDWKEALAKDQPLIYNKQTSLNPFFVVYGKQKQIAAEMVNEQQVDDQAIFVTTVEESKQ
eukprot:TRINITY_DN1785_c0_g1_i1.p2 TRINITY_DN1785_c0_g1~~TRINITY_DN1785_c0_g1_i1.p2  ORF type:complete len:332 (-),score=51.56 TRINITY_DN1785_c0_g1_i1:250-1245(-)